MLKQITDKLIRLVGRKKPSPWNDQLLNRNPRYAAFSIGDWSYGSPKVESWNEGSTLKIGKYCSIARGVTILLGGEHRIDWVTTYPFTELWHEMPKIDGHPATKGNVIIGNDVWIGTEAMLLSGITIGNGAVIGARSLVTKSVAPYSIVAGSPAKHIKWRFSEGQIEKLERIAWWDWSESKIRESIELLLNSDVQKFIDHCIEKT